MSRTVTDTGHEIGAVYRSAYWGYTYRVIGEGYVDGSGVRVELIEDPNRICDGQSKVWSHSTSLGPRDEKLS